MNSHICNSSPSFKVVIDWRRKGINRQPEVKQNRHARLQHYYSLAGSSLFPLSGGEKGIGRQQKVKQNGHAPLQFYYTSIVAPQALVDSERRYPRP